VRILELEAAGVECKTAISTRPEVREAFDMLAAGIANHRLSQSFEAFSKNTTLVVKASSKHCEFIRWYLLQRERVANRAGSES
jgi:hypothetical protein